MDWLVELLLSLLAGPFRDAGADRSVVGKSRLDEEADRWWKWVVVAALVIGATAWFIFRA